MAKASRACAMFWYFRVGMLAMFSRSGSTGKRSD